MQSGNHCISRFVLLAIIFICAGIAYGEDSRDPSNLQSEINNYRSEKPDYPSEKGFAFGRCVNINLLMDLNSFEAKAKVIDQIHANGINTIRIPLDLSHNTGQEPPYRVSLSYLKDVAEVARYGSEIGMNVILDFHRYPQLNADPYGEESRFVGIWEQASSAWQGLPANVLFEIYNEPRGNFTKPIYDRLMSKVTGIIRKTNPSRQLVVDTIWTAHYKALDLLELPSTDKKMIPSFHYYDPMGFTHQGASWNPKYKDVVRSFGSSDDIANFENMIDAVKRFIRNTGKVPLVGEFGATDYHESANRYAYLTLVAEGLASIGVPSCAWTWDFKRQAFSIQLGGKIITEMKPAIIPPR